MSQHYLHRHFTPAVVEAQHQAYIQHRGGPVGFLRVLNEHTLVFADYGGNRQLLTTGHLRRDPRVALFLMDDPNRRRLKIDGTAEVVPRDREPSLLAPLGPPDPGKPEVERLFRIQVDGYDWNCPQFITPRFTAAEVEGRERVLRQRIADLEAERRRLGPSAGDEIPVGE